MEKRYIPESISTPHIGAVDGLIVANALGKSPAFHLDRAGYSKAGRKRRRKLLGFADDLGKIEARTRELADSQERLRALATDLNLAEHHFASSSLRTCMIIWRSCWF